MPQERAGGLGGVALPPVGARQVVADLDLWTAVLERLQDPAADHSAVGAALEREPTQAGGEAPRALDQAREATPLAVEIDLVAREEARHLAIAEDREGAPHVGFRQRPGPQPEPFGGEPQALFGSARQRAASP